MKNKITKVMKTTKKSAEPTKVRLTKTIETRKLPKKKGP